MPSFPTVSIFGPAKGATYTLGQKSTARYSCADAGSGVAACTGSVADGGYIKTSSVGKYSFTVTATNSAGKSVTTTVSYTVSYKICQVTPPAQNSSFVTFKVYLCNAGGGDVTTRSTDHLRSERRRQDGPGTGRARYRRKTGTADEGSPSCLRRRGRSQRSN